MCEWKPDFEALTCRVNGIENRLTQVEADVGKMRSESQDGFKALTTSLSNLAHDFGDRMNTIDRRLVAEKEKWGEVLRTILKWTAITILSGCAVAMGVTAYQSIFVK